MSARRRVALPLALTTLATSAGVVYGALPAAAANACAPESAHQDMFVANAGLGTFVIGFGTDNEMEMIPRSDNPSCLNGYAQNWSAAHMMLGGHPFDQYEIGYAMARDAAGNHYISPFTEYTLNGTLVYHNDFPSACANQYPTPGSFRNFKVYDQIGTNKWTAQIDCEGGSGWHVLESNKDLSPYHSGWTSGEVGRFSGGTPSTAPDYQRNLARDDSTGTWSAWNAPVCQSDNLPDWFANPLGATTYQTESGHTC